MFTKTNSLLILFLENCKDYDILFIQKHSWSILQCISYASSEEGEEIIGAPNHLSQTLFTQNSNNKNKHLRVLTYINVRLTRLCFSLRKDIINHKDINLISFFNNGSICFLINIYSDDYQSTLKYFKDTEVNLNNILIITGDFNIRDNEWDASFPYHSNYTNFLKKIANSFNLELSTPVNQVSTRYTDNI